MLILIGVPALYGLYFVVSANGSLNSAMAEADRLDPGWRLEELEAKRATYSPDQNAANKIIKITGMIPQDYSVRSVQHTILQGLQPPALLNSDQIDALGKVMEGTGPARAEARMMIDFPHGRSATPWNPTLANLNWPLQEARAVLNLLQFDAMDLAQQGDADGALRSAHAAFHCGSSIGDEPTMISQLVRLACQAVAIRTLERVLAQGEPSEEVLAALQRRIEESEREPVLLIAFRGERAGQSIMLESIRHGTFGNAAGAPGPWAWPSILLRLPGVMAAQAAAGVEHLNELVEIAKQPPETWTTQFAAQQVKANSLPVHSQMLATSLNRRGPGVQRGHAMQRCAALALAAERFRKKNGRWPNSLDELKSAGLIHEIPTDPFVGGNTKFQRTDDGLIIYAVGQDLTDDGGKLDWNRPGNSGTDVGFQLWDVAKRRQPAPPTKSDDDTPP